jgi:acyl-CoA dehydrogenase
MISSRTGGAAVAVQGEDLRPSQRLDEGAEAEVVGAEVVCTGGHDGEHVPPGENRGGGLLLAGAQVFEAQCRLRDGTDQIREFILGSRWRASTQRPRSLPPRVQRMRTSELSEAVGRLLRDRCPPELVRAAEDGKPPLELWRTLEGLGLPLVSVPETAGGSGGTLAEACELLFLLGRAAAPVPVAETLLGGWLLAASGLPVPDGPLTVGPVRAGDHVEAHPEGDRTVLTGRLGGVPWARAAGYLVVLADDGAGGGRVAVVPASSWVATPGRNLAGEPRDEIVLTEVAVPAAATVAAPDGVTVETLLARGALTRAALMAGALHRVAEMTVAYAGERHQFGKPINSFQAVQNLVVQVAEQAECAALAVMAAALRFDEDPGAHAAVAKATAGRAAQLASRMAHEVHGAIGVTLEHDLGLFTRRLHAWAGEFGSARHWNTVLGRRLLAAGATTTRGFLSGDGAALR